MRGYNVCFYGKNKENSQNYPQYPLLSGALYCVVTHPKDADGMANSVDPDQTAH